LISINTPHHPIDYRAAAGNVKRAGGFASLTGGLRFLTPALFKPAQPESCFFRTGQMAAAIR
jgi:hypothetical protein